MAELFDQLLPCSWKGVDFPITEVRTELSHDIARHKKTDRDGARLENTGRNPLVFHVHAVFVNNIVPAKSEKWQEGKLYPLQYQRVLDKFAERSTGIFQHPYRGQIPCKAVNSTDTLAAKARGGVFVDFVFEESIEDGDVLAALGGTAPLNDVRTFAGNLDASIGKYHSYDPEKTLSFTDAAAAITSAFDQFTLLNAQAAGMINRVFYRIQTIQDAVNRAADVQNWPLTQSLERLRGALIETQRKALASQKDVSFYIAPKDSTLGLIANTLHQKMADMLQLNPSLASAPVVTRGTPVRYYTSA